MQNGRCIIRPLEQIRRYLYSFGFNEEFNGFDNHCEGQEGMCEADAKEFIVHSEAELSQYVQCNSNIEVDSNEIA